jgi:hypothetical protein
MGDSSGGHVRPDLADRGEEGHHELPDTDGYIETHSPPYCQKKGSGQAIRVGRGG